MCKIVVDKNVNVNFYLNYYNVRCNYVNELFFVCLTNLE